MVTDGTFKEMKGLFASLIRYEYFADVRMLYRVICGCLSAATSAYYPLQHPHIRILPPAKFLRILATPLCDTSTDWVVRFLIVGSAKLPSVVNTDTN